MSVIIKFKHVMVVSDITLTAREIVKKYKLVNHNMDKDYFNFKKFYSCQAFVDDTKKEECCCEIMDSDWNNCPHCGEDLESGWYKDFESNTKERLIKKLKKENADYKTKDIKYNDVIIMN